MSDNDASHFTWHWTEEKSGRKAESTDDCRKLAGDGRYTTVVSSLTQWQLRLEKLGRRHRQSTTVYDGRSVIMMTLSEDNLEPRCPCRCFCRVLTPQSSETSYQSSLQDTTNLIKFKSKLTSQLFAKILLLTLRAKQTLGEMEFIWDYYTTAYEICSNMHITHAF